MLVELTKVEPIDDTIKVNRVYINPKHIISVVEDNLKYYSLKESLIQAGIHNQMSISEVKVFDGTSVETILVLGHPKTIKEKINNKKQVLRG
jgi:hypothetical protein